MYIHIYTNTAYAHTYWYISTPIRLPLNAKEANEWNLITQAQLGGEYEEVSEDIHI